MKSQQRPQPVRSQTPTAGPSTGAMNGRGNAFLADQLRARAEGADEAGTPVWDLGHDHGTGAETPDRGDAGAGAVAGRKPGQDLSSEERASALAQLRGSPTTADTLAALEKTEGGLGFPMKWSGRGTYQMAGTIYIDLRATGLELVVTLSHELVHLLNMRKGNVPDVRGSGRQEFVDGMMSDELDSETASLLTGLQLTGGRGEPRSQEFKAWLEKTHPGLLARASKDPSLWQEIGRAHV